MVQDSYTSELMCTLKNLTSGYQYGRVQSVVWMRIGVFTGSRLAEYAQSNLRATQRYQMIPNNEDSGQWAGMALAFISDDFQFFDHDNCLVSKENLLSIHKRNGIHMVHIRFRFDKSKTNFSIRKFTTTDDMILNPVDAAVSILRRAEMLGVPSNEPVGVLSLIHL